MKTFMPENLRPYHFLEPAADAAGRTSVYISLKDAVKAWIVFYANQAAANTILLSPLQATAVAGTGSKAISACRIWSKQDEAGTSFTKETEAATFTTSAATKKKVVVFEIDCAKVLDIAGGFDCIGISTGASAAANITSAILIIEPRHGSAVEVSPITD